MALIFSAIYWMNKGNNAVSSANKSSNKNISRNRKSMSYGQWLSRFEPQGKCQMYVFAI
jgi:hypothetical protein